MAPVASSGTTLTFSVTSSEPWEVASNKAWLKAVKNGDKAEVTVEENSTTDTREGILTFNAGKSGTTTVTISQQEKKIASPSIAPQPRNVLIEEQTGENCPYCPYGAEILADLTAQYGDRVAIIAYHGSGFTPRNSPLFSTEAATRTSYLPGDEGFPAASINKGTLEGRGSWKSRVASKLGETVPMRLTVDEVKFEGNKITATIFAEGIEQCQTDYSNMRLAVDVVENKIAHDQQGAASGYLHQHVSRKWLAGCHGMEIIKSQAHYTVSGDLQSSWNKDNLELIVYVQHVTTTNGKDSGRKLVQVIKHPIRR